MLYSIYKGVINMLPLQITITKSSIFFKDLPDEVYTAIKKHHPELELTLKGNHAIYDKPEKLYKILIDLSYTYDLEIS